MVDYAKWDNLPSSDDEKETPAQSMAKKAQDKMGQQLLEAYQKDPSKVDELERSVKAMRAQLEEAKQVRDAGARAGSELCDNLAKAKEAATPDSIARGIKNVVGQQTDTLKEELEQLRQQSAELNAEADRLKQLEDCGDEASLLRYFQDQGMSMEQIQRGLSGDASAMMEELHAKDKEARRKAEKKSADAMRFADTLNTVVTSGELPQEASQEAPQVPRPEPHHEPTPPQPPKTEILMPDCFQRKATATDKHLIVTVSLPGVAKGGAKLDISETHCRVFAPAPDRDGRAREYRLNAKLAQKVMADGAKAKWKSKLEQLIITIPTLA